MADGKINRMMVVFKMSGDGEVNVALSLAFGCLRPGYPH
jgi:hypothetical protein